MERRCICFITTEQHNKNCYVSVKFDDYTYVISTPRTVHQLAHGFLIIAVQQAGNTVQLSLKLLHLAKHAHLRQQGFSTAKVQHSKGFSTAKVSKGFSTAQQRGLPCTKRIGYIGVAQLARKLLHLAKNAHQQHNGVWPRQ